MSIFDLNTALASVFHATLPSLCDQEGLPAETLRAAVEAGTMVLLANPNRPHVRPTLIGRPASIKVNANIGTSPMSCDPDTELAKLAACEEAGAHAFMDLSTAGDLDRIRRTFLARSRLPLGTVPIYALAKKLADADRDPADFQADELFEEIERQAEQGVDFMTVHCGVTRRAAETAAGPSRVLGIVSRGGSILARHMRRNDCENPLLTRYDDLLDIARRHNVVLSLGDGLRPGAGADAGDAPQWEEVVTLGLLARRALASGVQAMIEGPGHVPLHLVEAQIKGIKRATYGAPLYVLGPLVADCAAGHDHIAGAIGGALAALHGADFLCYLTPAEHLGLPSADDAYAGVIASRIAAHAGEAALGVPRAVARDLSMSQARKDLDWEAMTRLALDPKAVRERKNVKAERGECAMCGKFCAIRMLSE